MSETGVTSLTPDKVGKVRNGITMIVIWLINLPAMIVLWALSGVSNGGTVLPAIILSLFFIIAPMCLYMLQPNQAAVLTLFGAYRGSDETQGLRFTNLFYAKKKISLRVRNFTTHTAKVNDANGNPIEIGAVVVWRVVDVAKAVFGVESFTNYVHTQSESAVRNLARSYPYDSFEDGEEEITLIGDAEEVNVHLRTELQERANEAGVEILEARLNDLAYAPEIAEAMLRRQQASAIVAARAKIVEGAVLMVREAIDALEEGTDGSDPIQLDADRKATFASNLMTVIASDAPTAPVVNVGTLNR
ncbi:MAG: SPFH domain-containing protein [Acidimicrobiales bacterium]|nr:SPFH domain-containing protein [Acidimicrobiales bacterium]